MRYTFSGDFSVQESPRKSTVPLNLYLFEMFVLMLGVTVCRSSHVLVDYCHCSCSLR